VRASAMTAAKDEGVSRVNWGGWRARDSFERPEQGVEFTGRSVGIAYGRHLQSLRLLPLDASTGECPGSYSYGNHVSLSVQQGSQGFH